MPYTVWVGRKTGVFETWEETKELVLGYPGAKFKKFKTIDDALQAYYGYHPVDIYADASYRNGKLIVRVTDQNGKILHQDMFGVQVNAINIGEFIAAIRALSLSNGTVGTDSQVAYDWIQRGVVNTKMLLPDTLQKALDEALAWRQANPECRHRLKKIDRAFNLAD
ncbi:ribonuclease H [Thermus phage phiFa]|nr:ribonuclease H [Thermus phage phiFa]